MSVQRSSFTLVFFRAACHTNPHAVRKRANSANYDDFNQVFTSPLDKHAPKKKK